MMEKSAGMVLFRERKRLREYLLLKSTYMTPFWGFAKGRPEAGEEELDAARREAREETGLQEVEIIPQFREKTSYFKTVNGQKVHKEVIWFLGKALDRQDGQVSSEHEELCWLPYPEALQTVTYKQEKGLLMKAEKKLSLR